MKRVLMLWIAVTMVLAMVVTFSFSACQSNAPESNTQQTQEATEKTEVDTVEAEETTAAVETEMDIFSEPTELIFCGMVKKIHQDLPNT